jgi:hypothetical protein
VREPEKQLRHHERGRYNGDAGTRRKTYHCTVSCEKNISTREMGQKRGVSAKKGLQRGASSRSRQARRDSRKIYYSACVAISVLRSRLYSV